MKIEVRNELSLTAQDDAEIGALLDQAFGAIGEDGFQGRSYYKQRHHVRVLGRDAGLLVGHIAMCFRVIRVGDELIPIVGLAEVATAPDQGRKGIASALLRKTIAVARDTQAAFIVLFGSHPIYTKNGFIAAPTQLTYMGIENARSMPLVTRVDPDLKLLPLTARAWDDQADVDLLGHIF
jgi:predicted N-acetyltransferase YhbS